MPVNYVKLLFPEKSETDYDALYVCTAVRKMCHTFVNFEKKAIMTS